MITPTRFDEEAAARYRRDGWWADVTLAQRFESAVASHGDRPVLTDGEVLTYAQLEGGASAFAGALASRGVGRGDVVSFQLPNWWETAIVMLGVARLGAVCNPLQMIYRQTELRFILAQCESKALVVPGMFRGTDYQGMANEVASELPHAPIVVATRACGATELGALLEEGETPPDTFVSPDDVLLLMYTSGTTSEPKGVLHTHNTLLRSAQDLVDLFRYGPEDKVFMPSPVTHITGLLLGFIAPWLSGAGTVLDDQWAPREALLEIVNEGCTFTGGATTFIRGYIDAARGLGLGPNDIPLVKGPCGGADVPPSVIREGQEVLGARFTRIYGATEGVTITGTASDRPFDLCAETDGCPLPGYELRILRPDRSDVSIGEIGDIEVRGPGNFVGYYDAGLNADCFTADGFIKMGDLGVWDEDGHIRIQGRFKDIIIRNGENISAKEVEDILVTHPEISDVAIIAVPDPDTGERACAYIVAHAAAPTLKDIRVFLDGAQIAKQKYPEYMIVVEEMPRTASGKIQKFKLREDVRTRELRLEPR
jgi:cyclohexanecarboxylate-CoA ligase